jgi:hypothetical protein
MELAGRAAEAQRRAAELQERVLDDERWTAELMSRNAELAARVAETEQALAATLLRLARQRPHSRAVLMKLSRDASEFAARAGGFAARAWQWSKPGPGGTSS